MQLYQGRYKTGQVWSRQHEKNRSRNRFQRRVSVCASRSNDLFRTCCLNDLGSQQARILVLRFWGKIDVQRGKIFVLSYVENKFSWIQQNFWGHKENFGGTALECSPWLLAWKSSSLAVKDVIRISTKKMSKPHSSQLAYLSDVANRFQFHVSPIPINDDMASVP